jgi:hypothetical protein
MAVGKGALTHYLGHQMRHGFFLRDLDHERVLFCSLVVAEMDHRRLAMRRRLRHSPTATGATSIGTPASKTVPAAMVMVGPPPPSSELVREAPVRRIDDGGFLGAMATRCWTTRGRGTFYL